MRTRNRKTPMVEKRGWEAREKAIVVIALLLGIALVVGLWPKDRPHTVAKVTDEETETVATNTPSHDYTPPAPAAPPAAAAPDPNTPVIDEVTIEKKEVCQGEDNMVTVRAHTENGTDTFLNYVIDGKQGSSVPLRLLAENGQIVGKHTIEVFGKNKALVTVPVPEFKVKPCKAPYLAEVRAGLQPNTWGIYDFVATIGPFRGLMARPTPPPTFTPVRFEWTFGDGEKETTNTGTVTHSYEGRTQDAEFSYMNVSVKILSEQGDTATARTSLALTNPAFEALSQKGIVQLFVALDPQFPVLDERGLVTQNVRVWHTYPQPVTIESATMIKYYTESKKSRESQPQSVDVASLLGTTTIPPGKEGVRATVVLDTNEDPQLFSANYYLVGKSPKGERVMGSFSVMRPPPKPNASNSKPISDPLLLAKVRATRSILNKDVVNDMDIAALEAQGRFANLDVAPKAAPVQAAPPPPVAPPSVAVAPRNGSAAAPVAPPAPAAPAAPGDTAGSQYDKPAAPPGDPNAPPTDPAGGPSPTNPPAETR